MSRPLTEKRANAMLAQLSDHFGVRVAPVTDVCKALDAWGKATGQNRWPSNLEAAKSCLLNRLVYLGEDVRLAPCPKHKGHWSGCKWGPDFCDCQKHRLADGTIRYGSNVTGWLLDGNPPITREDA